LIIATALTCAAALALGGCAARIRSAVAGSLVEDVATATSRQDDVALVADAIPTVILLVEGLLESDPDNQKLLMSAAEVYTSFGTLVEPDDPARARNLYLRAKSYGLRALAQKTEIAPLLGEPYPRFVHILDLLQPKDVPLVFWAASSWGAWIGMSTDSMTALAELPKVIALMEWIVEIDESFNFGSPHLFLGVYHSALPRALGGNPEKAHHHFSRALAISNRHALMTYVLMAKYYARQVFDRRLYESLLDEALSRPVDAVPELVLQNTAAQKHARQLLAEADEFF